MFVKLFIALILLSLSAGILANGEKKFVKKTLPTDEYAINQLSDHKSDANVEKIIHTAKTAEEIRSRPRRCLEI